MVVGKGHTAGAYRAGGHQRQSAWGRKRGSLKLCSDHMMNQELLTWPLKLAPTFPFSHVLPDFWPHFSWLCQPPFHGNSNVILQISHTALSLAVYYLCLESKYLHESLACSQRVSPAPGNLLTWLLTLGTFQLHLRAEPCGSLGDLELRLAWLAVCLRVRS